MYKPYKNPVITASADVKVSSPKISNFFIFIVSILKNIYFFSLFGFAKVILHSDDILFDVFKRALAKESRCIIAFRHPDGREPQLLMWFILFKLKNLAAKKKIRFALKPHSIFVYGYEVARWGGWVARLFMPNLGAIPIHHTKMDSKGMARIFNAITEGPYPLSLAPEGQVSYSTDTLPRLEQGVVRIGFQAAEKIQEKNLNCPLEILPISVHFRYDNFGKAAMEKLLKKIENICGFKKNVSLSFSQRLEQCRNYILQINEERYNIKINTSVTYEQRLEKMINKALETAEKILGIKTKGEPLTADDYFTRLYKVRHDCWDNIFLPEYENLNDVTKLKRNILDLKAGLAWYASRHQELADFGWYFKHPIPNEDTFLHLKVEYVQNLYDFANRSMGGALSGRVNIMPCKVIIKAAPCINLTEKLTQYKEDRKKASNDAIKDLEKIYLECIEDVNKTF